MPAPDPIASDYLLLGLRFDQHLPGLVDGYYGPADLKARVDTEQLRSPRRLLETSPRSPSGSTAEVDAPGPSCLAVAQLQALDAHARALAGEPLSVPRVRRALHGLRAARATRTASSMTAVACDRRLLPGPDPVAERLRHGIDAARDPGRIACQSVAEWLLGRFRDRAAHDFGLPEGETAASPSSGTGPGSRIDWYLGGRRSRIEINIDLPVHRAGLIVTLAHERLPGPPSRGGMEGDGSRRWTGTRLEASMILTNTPEGPVSEGSPATATRFASPLDERADLLLELVRSRWAGHRGRSGCGPRGRRAQPSALIAAAERPRCRDPMRPRSADMPKVRQSEDVLAYLRDVGRYPHDVAAKRLEFIDDPLSRLYVVRLRRRVRSWSHGGSRQAEAPDRVGRFGRLLHEQVTPGRLLAERG